MFNFLKKLLGRQYNIKITGYNHPNVNFSSQETLGLGLVDVIAEVEGQKIRARLDVKEVGLEGGTGVWVEPQEAVPYLKDLFPPYKEKRDYPRLHRRLRVLSKHLPGFKATSLDISRSGMRLEVSEPVPLDKAVHLTVDLDDASATTIEIEGVTRWCAPKVQSPNALLGVEFTEMPPSAEFALIDFIRTLAATEKGEFDLGG